MGLNASLTAVAARIYDVGVSVRGLSSAVSAWAAQQAAASQRVQVIPLPPWNTLQPSITATIARLAVAAGVPWYLVSLNIRCQVVSPNTAASYWRISLNNGPVQLYQASTSAISPSLAYTFLVPLGMNVVTEGEFTIIAEKVGSPGVLFCTAAIVVRD